MSRSSNPDFQTLIGDLRLAGLIEPGAIPRGLGRRRARHSTHSQTFFSTQHLGLPEPLGRDACDV
jgi:hypothetical protein